MKIQLLAIAESQLPKSVLQNSCFPKKAVAETQQHQQKLPVAIDLRANEIQIYSELTGEKTASFAQLKEDEQELLAVGNQSTIGNESDFKHYIREDAAKLDKVQATSLDTTGKGDEQKVLAKLEEKTALLARLEEDLKKREDLIIQTAFEHTVGRIKEVQSKFDVLGRAQAQTTAGISEISEQAVTLGQKDASHGLASITMTVITSKAAADSETHVEGSATVVGKPKTQIESSKPASYSPSTHVESPRR